MLISHTSRCWCYLNLFMALLQRNIACVKLVPRVLSLTRFYVLIDVVSIDHFDSSLSLKMISFVLFPQTLVPSLYFDISKLVCQTFTLNAPRYPLPPTPTQKKKKIITIGSISLGTSVIN